MVEVMMGDEDRVDRVQRHARAHQLQDDAASGVEQDVLLAEADQRGRRVALGIGPRPAGSEKNDLHERCSRHSLKVKPVDADDWPQRS